MFSHQIRDWKMEQAFLEARLDRFFHAMDRMSHYAIAAAGASAMWLVATILFK